METAKSPKVKDEALDRARRRKRPGTQSNQKLFKAPEMQRWGSLAGLTGERVFNFT